MRNFFGRKFPIHPTIGVSTSIRIFVLDIWVDLLHIDISRYFRDIWALAGIFIQVIWVLEQ